MSKKKQGKTIKNVQVIPQQNKRDWLPPVLFSLAAVLVFYPPLLGGLFLDSRMFASHIFTSLVFAFILAKRIYDRQYVLLQTPMDWAILAYAGAYLLSLIGAVHPGEAFYGFLKALNYLMVYLIVASVVDSARQVREMLKVLLAAGLVVAAIGLLAAAGYSDYPGALKFGLIMSTLQYSNTMAAYLAVMILLGVALLQQENNTCLKVVYSAANVIMALAFLGSMSKGAWVVLAGGALLLVLGMPGIHRIKSIFYLGLGMGTALFVYRPFHAALSSTPDIKPLLYVGLGVLLAAAGVFVWDLLLRIWTRHKHGPLMIILACALILSAGAYIGGQVLLSSDIVKELADLSNSQDDSYVTRIDFMRTAVEIAKDYPVNGAGAGGWKALFQQHQQYYFYATQAHSHFSQLLVETGIVGLLVFISMWGILLYYLYKIYGNREKNDGEQWILGWGIAAGCIALGVHAAFDFDLSIPAMSMILWTMLALLNSLFKQTTSSGKTVIKPVNGWMQCGIAGLLVLVLLISGSRYLYAADQAVKGNADFTSAMKQKHAGAQIEGLSNAIRHYAKAVQSDPLNGSYRGDLATVQGTVFRLLDQNKDSNAAQYRQESIAMMKSAAALYPGSYDLQTALFGNAASIGDMNGILEYGKMRIKTSPNKIVIYENNARIWWDACRQCEANDQHEMAVKFARQIIQMEKVLHRQIQSVEPDHPYWQERRLVIEPKLESVFQQARDFIAADKEKK